MDEQGHCNGHSGIMALLHEHSKTIADLYEKHDETRKVLEEIKLCTMSMSLKMEQGFKECNDSISKLTCEVAHSRIERTETLKHYDGIVETVSKRLDELDKFKWFRDRINKWHDNLPVIIFSFIMSIIGILTILHWINIGEFLKGRIK